MNEYKIVLSAVGDGRSILTLYIGNTKIKSVLYECLCNELEDFLTIINDIR